MARSVSLRIPAGATANSTDSAGSGNIPKDCGVPERLLTLGATYGHVYDVGYAEITVAAGAPGSTDTDLAAAGKALDGSTLVGLAGKLVYMEIRVMTGNDCQMKVSGANAIEFASGTTDSLNIYGRVVLVDYLNNEAYTAMTPPTFDATHKMLKLTSTGGCTVRVIYAVI